MQWGVTLDNLPYFSETMRSCVAKVCKTLRFTLLLMENFAFEFGRFHTSHLILMLVIAALN